MKKYKVNVNGAAYEVEIELISESDVGKTAPAAAPAPKAAPAQAPAPVQAPAPAQAPAAPAGEGVSVTSPMPGNIWEVKVAVGQKVKSGDVLLILEAMKMENEIVSPADGTVKQIAVAKGDAVAAAQLLCVIA